MLLSMGTRARKPILSLGVVGLLVVVLIGLAVLQYRWSGQISEAERERLQSSLNISTSQFRDEFQRELGRMAGPFLGDPRGPGGTDLQQLADRYEALLQGASHPDLLSQVYLWPNDGPVRRLDRKSRHWEDAAPPPPLTAWHQRVNTGIPGRPGFGITWEPSIPALVRPLYRLGERREGPGSEPRESREHRDPGPPPAAGWILVTLNEEYIQREFLPELAQRYFGGPGGWAYQVAVLDTHTRQILYRSADVSFDQPDGRVNLSELPAALQAGEGGPHRRRSRGEAVGAGERNPRFRGPGGRGAAILQAGTDGAQWQLLAKHPSGSVETAVSSLRWRNLAVSFGVLLLLAASMAIILVSAQRAHRLADMQMEFVAGVSHELRTPLAVICSAADNLADGVVAAKPQVEQYGDLIRTEGRRLADMVEQILRFASGQAGKVQYETRPVPVEEVVESAVLNVQPLLQSSGGTLDTALSDDLPLALADPAALCQCLNNLLTNAIKYGGDTPWVGLRATAGPGNKQLILAVEDRGLGIQPNELSHIFEPFFRGAAVAAAQIHGTGLGLSLTKRMAEAMGGRLAVQSAPGQGSTFTLTLPAAPPEAENLAAPSPRLS